MFNIHHKVLADTFNSMDLDGNSISDGRLNAGFELAMKLSGAQPMTAKNGANRILRHLERAEEVENKNIVRQSQRANRCKHQRFETTIGNLCHKLLAEGSVNRATEQISELLNVDISAAETIQERMSLNGLDFSKCTTAQFNRAARLAAKQIGYAKITRQDFFASVATTEATRINVSAADESLGDGVMLLQIGSEFDYHCAYLSEAQVASLILALKNYLAAPKG